ncbi:MAG: bacillithiol biosynthesis cysteine-adding enzyme BshC [Rhodothermales bacterium]|nr:bacillithiol biosynthesis cysteine-adding enzyme BshC [Rhodothermales bacterium]
MSGQVSRTPYGDLPGFSRLFVDYVEGRSSAADYYARRFDEDSLLAFAPRTAAAKRADRSAVAEILVDQQSWWDHDAAALESARRLHDPEATVIVTGQQVGLFAGPLYTVLKALSTVLIARRLETLSGKPVVPIFWLGSEDHDFEEMASASVPGRTFTVPKPDVDNTGPVGALPFGPEIADLVEQLGESLPTTDFHAEVMAMVRTSYAPGNTFRDAFAQLLRRLLPETGLVLFAQDDPRVKRLAAPVWKREIENWEGADTALRATSERLADAYHAQVHIRPSNLFMIEDGQRLPLDVEDGRFHLRGTSLSWDRDELVARLEAKPESFSPNVVLRPLTQDWLFPTVAYVGGPGETAYFAQYQDVYAWAGIPMPAIVPRTSLTLIEPGIRRSLDRLGVPTTAFSGDPDALFSQLARERMEFDVEARFGRTIGEVNKLIAPLTPEVVRVDASLKKSVEATRAALQNEIMRLRDRVLKADRRNRDQLRQQVEKVAEGLFPNGRPQERVISPLYFATKYGPDFFVRLMEDLDTDTRSHLLIDL